MPTPMRAAMGIPTPRPTPRAVVLGFFAGSKAGVVMEVEERSAVKERLEVADAPLIDTEESTDDIVFVVEVLANTLDDDTIGGEVEEAVDVWVCVYDSPIMVTVYTSAGDCAKVKISDPELAWQLQPS